MPVAWPMFFFLVQAAMNRSLSTIPRQRASRVVATRRRRRRQQLLASGTAVRRKSAGRLRRTAASSKRHAAGLHSVSRPTPAAASAAAPAGRCLSTVNGLAAAVCLSQAHTRSIQDVYVCSDRLRCPGLACRGQHRRPVPCCCALDQAHTHRTRAARVPGERTWQGPVTLHDFDLR